jgi:hypothetical protein
VSRRLIVPSRRALRAPMSSRPAAITTGRRHGMVAYGSRAGRLLWTLSDSEAGFISGIYSAGYVTAVPVAIGRLRGNPIYRGVGEQ